MHGRLLAEITHGAHLLRSGRTVGRSSARGIVRRDGRLLMVCSRNGDYKFPGGGVEPGESVPDAVRRELAEECGARVLAVGEPFGRVVEYAVAKEAGYDLFANTSWYLRCEIADELGAQHLEDDERELGLVPTWVDLDEAIGVNSALLAGGGAAPRWLRRETTVLRLLRDEPH
ncbi:NUDIX domain-containing protein [Longispora sp. NPDC051575]|uniref:NUDIX domain-containing protein n=1 Tax=Longispora sp. NPDC051575 TaxID=3154943 RepID=UPI003421F42D